MAQDVNIKIKVDTSQANTSTDNYKARLKQLKDEMIALRIQTDGLTKASDEQKRRFSELEREAGNIADAMGDAGQRIKNLSDDFQGMTAALQGIGAAVGGVTAASGAMSLFGVENEKAAETIKKLTALMSVLQGIQTVEKALNKDSALMTALRAKAQKNLTKELTKTASAEATGTAATATFTAAEGAATVGAITLKGAVKAVGTAIKSVPVIGWILAAISAIITLIGLITDANDEEERGNEILDQKKQLLDDIYDAYRKNLNSIMREGELLRENIKLLKNQTDANLQYVDTYKKLSDYTGLSVEYLQTLNEKQLLQIENDYEILAQQKASLANSEKELETLEQQNAAEWEITRAKSFIDTLNKAIVTSENKILGIRQKEYDWQQKTTDKTKEQAKQQKRLENAAREHQKFIEESKKELEELNAAIYGTSEEEQITEKYDKLLDYALKYYGAESEQVAKVNELRLQALEDLRQKQEQADEELAKQRLEDERKAQDEVAKIEAAKLETQLTALKENSTAYYEKKLEIDRQAEDTEKLELERQLADNLISYETYLSQYDLLTATHAKTRADIEIEAAKQTADEITKIEKQKLDYADKMISAFSDIVSASMEAELDAAEGNEEEQKKIRKKYARSKFLTQIGSIGISTAQAIMEAWSSVASIMFPGNVIAGGALTAMLSATGIAQSLKARAEMDNALKAARGGILNGPSHAQGGIMLSNGVEAEGGEAIINKKSTAAFAPLLSEINSFNGYGAPLISWASANGGTMGEASDEMIRRIVAATVEGVTSIPVVVSEHAVTEAQRTVRLTKERSLI